MSAEPTKGEKEEKQDDTAEADPSPEEQAETEAKQAVESEASLKDAIGRAQDGKPVLEEPDAGADEPGGADEPQDEPREDATDDGDGDSADETRDEDTSPEIPATLRERAEAAGLTEAAIERFGDNIVDLDELVSLVEGKAGSGKGDDDSATATDADPKKEAEGADEGFKVELDEEEHGKEVVDAIKGLNDHWKGRYDKLQETVQSLTSSAQSTQAQETVRELDKQMARIGQAERFGDGPTTKLPRNGRAYKERMEFLGFVENFASILGPAVQEMGDDELVDRALAAKYPDAGKSNTVKKISKTLRRRTNGNVPRGAHADTEAKPSDGEQADKAEDNIAGAIERIKRGEPVFK